MLGSHGMAPPPAALRGYSSQQEEEEDEQVHKDIPYFKSIGKRIHCHGRLAG
jgi:hypothetical protein